MNPERPDSMPSDLRALVEAAIAKGRQNLEKHGYLFPVFIIGMIRPRNTVTVPGIGSIRNKAATMRLLKDFCEATDPDFVIGLSEAWYRAGATKEEAAQWNKTGLENDPKRLEAIHCWVQSRDGMWTGWAPLIRKPNRPPTFETISFSETKEDDEYRLSTRVINPVSSRG